MKKWSELKKYLVWGTLAAESMILLLQDLTWCLVFSARYYLHKFTVFLSHTFAQKCLTADHFSNSNKSLVLGLQKTSNWTRLQLLDLGVGWLVWLWLHELVGKFVADPVMTMTNSISYPVVYGQNKEYVFSMFFVENLSWGCGGQRCMVVLWLGWRSWLCCSMCTCWCWDHCCCCTTVVVALGSGGGHVGKIYFGLPLVVSNLLWPCDSCQDQFFTDLISTKGQGLA